MRKIGWLFSQRSAKLSVTITLVTAMVLLQPSQMWTQEPTTQSLGTAAAADQTAPSIPPLTQCKLGTQPLNAIDMNTVSFRSNVKTVHSEKEFFNCMAIFPNIPAPQPVIAMVTIYSELFENLGIGSIIKSNTIETCVKELNGTVLGCQIAPAIPQLPPITTCTTKPLSAPVRMNTVVATGPSTNPNVAETVEAEKEVFSCNPSATGQPTMIEDVIIFTKILEDMNTGKTLSTQFVVDTCVKNIATLNVACQ